MRPDFQAALIQVLFAIVRHGDANSLVVADLLSCSGRGEKCCAEQCENSERGNCSQLAAFAREVPNDHNPPGIVLGRLAVHYAPRQAASSVPAGRRCTARSRRDRRRSPLHAH